MAKKEYIAGLATGVLLMVSIGSGAFLGLRAGTGESALADRETRNKLRMLETMIDEQYLGEKDEEALKEGLYTGLVYGLGDPYSRYYTAEEYEEENSATQGGYAGIGVVIQKTQEGGILAAECYEGAPAEKAGMKTGDLILTINGEDLTGKELREVVKMIKDKNGETVKFTVQREGEAEPLELNIEVAEVELPAVSHEMLDDKTGYIRISEFTGVAPQQYKAAAADLKKDGMKALVVDLRNNPGGLMSSVCEILREILPEGLIVYTEDKNGNREEETCDGSHPLELPLAVLVNENSASASEIFAGAVKDYGIGTIVGTTTFGKGIVQSIQKLSDGSALKLTIADYYTPNGNSIHKVGIKPDVEVKTDAQAVYSGDVSREEDGQLQAALKVLSEESGK